jgi:hypothetical protein
MKLDYNYCYHLVAFIDVLGQKEAFQGIDVIPAHDDESTKKKLIKAHEETAYFIEIFREAFEDIFNTYVEDSESKVLVPGFKKAKFEKIRNWFSALEVEQAPWCQFSPPTVVWKYKS